MGVIAWCKCWNICNVVVDRYSYRLPLTPDLQDHRIGATMPPYQMMYIHLRGLLVLLEDKSTIDYFNFNGVQFVTQGAAFVNRNKERMYTSGQWFALEKLIAIGGIVENNRSALSKAPCTTNITANYQIWNRGCCRHYLYLLYKLSLKLLILLYFRWQYPGLPCDFWTSTGRCRT